MLTENRTGRRIVNSCVEYPLAVQTDLHMPQTTLGLIIEPEELARLLDDDQLLIVDLCSDEHYSRHHLPGAIHVSPAEIVSGIKPAVGKLPTEERLKALLERIGYSPERHIVAYDDEGGGWAGRFIWTMVVLGHESCSYLNGGLIAWAQAQLPLTAVTPDITPTRVAITINRDVIAEKEDVLSAIDDENTQIWDARSAEEYAGSRVVAARGGHVPGAINLDWLDLMDPDRQLRLRADLAELVRERGLNSDKAIITHCQTHHRSGLTWLAGRFLGLNIRAYPGSWSEWGNDPDTPIDNPVG